LERGAYLRQKEKGKEGDIRKNHIMLLKKDEKNWI